MYEANEMPKVRKKPTTILTNSDVVQDDNNASNDSIDFDSSEGINDTCDNLVPSVVKMKLNSFCENNDIRKKINKIVMDANRLLGEAYSFANFHILKILSSQRICPTVDRSFFYRCLLAVSITKCRSSTIVEMVESIKEFDELRDENSKRKVNAEEYNQLLADLSIIMATMSTNSLLMNIEGRIQRFISWKFPEVNTKMRKSISNVLVTKPNDDLTNVFAVKKNTPKNQETQMMHARRVASLLRPFIKIKSKLRFASQSHLTLPLYHYILNETEGAKEQFVVNQSITPTKKKFRGKLFTLLPTKANYTISSIPISSMFMMKILKSMKLEKFKGDGRDVDHIKIWRRHFNVNLVDTRTRHFAQRIVSDGCTVSILMAKKTCHVCPNNTCPEKGECRIILNEDSGYVRMIGVDPGITDVVTSVSSDDQIQSYSSSQYYERAHYNTSRRRIDKWNEETKNIVQNIPTNKTTSIDRLKDNIRAYISTLPQLLHHRATKGYRNMRFLRFIGKKQTINEICEMLAPKDKITIIGFGNWKGPDGTPIVRRCSGPLQEIKLQLENAKNVKMLIIDEFRTSKTCSKCHNELSNMIAETTKIQRRKGKPATIIKQISKIHKVIHCKSSHNEQHNVARCGTTWNRDVNAAKNILEQALCEIFEIPRPLAMSRLKRD